MLVRSNGLLQPHKRSSDPRSKRERKVKASVGHKGAAHRCEQTRENPQKPRVGPARPKWAKAGQSVGRVKYDRHQRPGARALCPGRGREPPQRAGSGSLALPVVVPAASNPEPPSVRIHRGTRAAHDPLPKAPKCASKRHSAVQRKRKSFFTFSRCLYSAS